MNLTLYKEILNNAIKNDYTFVKFDEIDKYNKFIILRHDIDVDLFSAYNLAQIEYQMGCLSTYFFMVTNPLYNILSNDGKKIINEIKEMGHSIGIHFDGSNNHNSKYEEGELLKQINLIKIFFNLDVEFVSFHQPDNFILNNEITINNACQSVYNSRFTQIIYYISDSANRWLKNNINDLINDNDVNKIQFLTHPLWWRKKEQKDSKDKIDDFLNYQLECNKNNIKVLLNNTKKDVVVY